MAAKNQVMTRFHLKFKCLVSNPIEMTPVNLNTQMDGKNGEGSKLHKNDPPRLLRLLADPAPP